MYESIGNRKLARLLQKALGEIFLQKTSQLLGAAMITVTEVQVSSDLSLAKVYLSFIFDKDPADLLASITHKKGEIRRQLAHRVGKKIRRVPELDFYIDNSVAHATHMDQLFAELDLSKKEEPTL